VTIQARAMASVFRIRSWAEPVGGADGSLVVRLLSRARRRREASVWPASKPLVARSSGEASSEGALCAAEHRAGLVVARYRWCSRRRESLPVWEHGAAPEDGALAE
jgi:hypothetical protein